MNHGNQAIIDNDVEIFQMLVTRVEILKMIAVSIEKNLFQRIRNAATGNALIFTSLSSF